jgi:hypothetical protein
MVHTIGSEAFKTRPERDERRYGHLRSLREGEPSTVLTRGHPLGDDNSRAVRREGEEDPFAGEGDDLPAIYRERLAISRVPWIVNGDRR